MLRIINENYNYNGMTLRDIVQKFGDVYLEYFPNGYFWSNFLMGKQNATEPPITVLELNCTFAKDETPPNKLFRNLGCMFYCRSCSLDMDDVIPDDTYLGFLIKFGEIRGEKSEPYGVPDNDDYVEMHSKPFKFDCREISDEYDVTDSRGDLDIILLNWTMFVEGVRDKVEELAEEGWLTDEQMALL